MQFHVKVNTKRLLGDLQTPIGIYLKIRDLYAQSALLESTDFSSAENSNSYIAFCPIAQFLVKDGEILTSFLSEKKKEKVVDKNSVPDCFYQFLQSFSIEQKSVESAVVNGFFGYSSYEAVRYFEDINLCATKRLENDLPQIQYTFYKYIIALNHFKNEIQIIENLIDSDEQSHLLDIERILESPNISQYKFSIVGEEKTPISDEQYIEMVERGKQHCFRGDVFQIVLSRRYEQQFQGDDIMLYRTLRSINPSPYLFYFDMGNCRILGSSPEVHLRVKNDKAYIMPIAGTFRRSGNEQDDLLLAEQLRNDPKENAEHVMLVDLARNDLSRNAENVQVEEFRSVQFFSHVLHLVSKVSGSLAKDTNVMKLFADTFPAGTLSGAPKVRALQLIDEIEPHDRGFYGGCIGYIGFDGAFDQAITIRSFLSRNNTLYYQAGAGIVAKSVSKNELQEVKNKLAALRMAIQKAEKK